MAMGSVIAVAVAPQSAWRTDRTGDAVIVTATGADPGADGLSVVRATARAVWDAWVAGHPPTLRAGDADARAALSHWSLLDTPIG